MKKSGTIGHHKISTQYASKGVRRCSSNIPCSQEWIWSTPRHTTTANASSFLVLVQRSISQERIKTISQFLSEVIQNYIDAHAHDQHRHILPFTEIRTPAELGTRMGITTWSFRKKFTVRQMIGTSRCADLLGYNYRPCRQKFGPTPNITANTTQEAAFAALIMLFGITDGPERFPHRSRKRAANAASSGSKKKLKATKESVDNELLHACQASEFAKGKERGHVIDYLRSRYRSGKLGTSATP